MIVDFLEGDPDQPIIVGTVYNSDQLPPYLGQGPDGKHKNDNKGLWLQVGHDDRGRDSTSSASTTRKTRNRSSFTPRRTWMSA
ncbi:MAG: hypothetical protein IPF66_06515 [Holophagales bacterium]|nr:hypothetical protein [Holophagales bacterium]